jgi:hypothetical protein
MSIGGLVFSGLGHLIVLRKQHYQLVADLTRLLLMIGTTWTAAKFGLDGATAILMVSLSSLLGHVVFFAAHLMAYRNLGIRGRPLSAVTE